ncbi:unnamed protein product, partial [Onchocerca ochengi]
FTNGILNESSLRWNFDSYSLPKKMSNESIESEYVAAIQNIVNSMNTTVNPCDDFFQYACGRWIDEHPIPDDKSGYGTSAITTDIVRHQMKGNMYSVSDNKLSFII